jgi:hypothetical protein
VVTVKTGPRYTVRDDTRRAFGFRLPAFVEEEDLAMLII